MGQRQRSTTDSPREYNSVEEMVRGVSEDPAFAAEFENLLSSRTIIKKLASLRAAPGMSQAQIAEGMGCTQSRISKLESSLDNEMRLGDLRCYAEVLGSRIHLSLIPADATVVDRVKFHAVCIRRLLDDLVRLAGMDPKFANSVACFFGEAAVNLMAILEESAKGLRLAPMTRLLSASRLVTGRVRSDGKRGSPSGSDAGNVALTRATPILGPCRGSMPGDTVPPYPKSTVSKDDLHGCMFRVESGWLMFFLAVLLGLGTFTRFVLGKLLQNSVDCLSDHVF